MPVWRNQEWGNNGIKSIWRDRKRDIGALSRYYQNVTCDDFIVMPNHIHGIICLNGVGAQFIAPDNNAATNQGVMNHAPTVGEIVRGFKARCSRSINITRNTPAVPVWQRNYYEHVIRNDNDLNRIREYIRENLAMWTEDEESVPKVWVFKRDHG